MIDKTGDQTHVLVVDDDAVVRTAIGAALSGAGYYVSEARNGQAGVEQAASLQPDVITMDILMPPGISGIEATRRIVQDRPNARVVMFSVHDAETVVAAAVAAGATSYIAKAAGLPMLLDAIARSHAGQSVLIPAPKQWMTALSDRGREVLDLAVKGLSAREIGSRLQLSSRTVENHLSDIYARLGVNSRMQLIHMMTSGEVTTDGISTRHGPEPAATRLQALTPAERTIVNLVAQGRSNREIARDLYVSRHTVDAHLRKIFAKLGVNSRTALAILVGQEHPARGIDQASSSTADTAEG